MNFLQRKTNSQIEEPSFYIHTGIIDGSFSVGLVYQITPSKQNFRFVLVKYNTRSTCEANILTFVKCTVSIVALEVNVDISFILDSKLNM